VALWDGRWQLIQPASQPYSALRGQSPRLAPGGVAVGGLSNDHVNRTLSFDFRVDRQSAIVHAERLTMRRFWITISGVITSVILFCFCFVDPTGARSCCRDINQCVSQCIEWDGSIYDLMECIGLCSRFGGPRPPVFQSRSRGELRGVGLTRSECRKAARLLFPQDFRHRREARRLCILHQRLH
jgi:hypothetical protein